MHFLTQRRAGRAVQTTLEIILLSPCPQGGCSLGQDELAQEPETFLPPYSAPAPAIFLARNTASETRLAAVHRPPDPQPMHAREH